MILLQRRTALQTLGVAGLHNWAFGGFALAQQVSREEADRAFEKARQELIDAFPFPVVRVAGDMALESWKRIRDEGSGWPVIVGDDEELAMLAESLTFGSPDQTSRKAILDRAGAFSYPDDYRARLRADLERANEALGAAGLGSVAETMSDLGTLADSEEVLGDWPSEPPPETGLTVTEKIEFNGNDYAVKTLDQAVIVTLPTRDWTEVFADLAYGGWNACPFPHEHVAAFRRWNARYGLELVGMSHDTLNLRAKHRPATRDEALALAREQYEFCTDIVDQGVPLRVLAAGLMANDWWFFWWD